jgi:S1-C subfamily serine protease
VLVLSLLAGGVGWWLVAGREPKPAADTATAPAAPTTDAANSARPPEPTEDLLARTRKATAFITVEAGGQSGSGSGFVVRANGDTGYVVTNHHVVAVRQEEPPVAQPARPGPPFGPPVPRPPGFPGGVPVPRPPGFKGGPPGFPGGPPGFGPGFGFPGAKQAVPKVQRRVTVVFNSGTPDEQTAPAEVVAVDGEADLAVLRVTGVRNLPAPVEATAEAAVAETAPVFIYGFPGGRGGKSENPAVTVGKGTVSGLRRDANNRLNDIHVNGEVNPGNSGGPVVDAKGRLVGVAVATVPGKQIGFVVPAVQLTEMFRGSVLGAFVCQVKQRGTGATLTGELWLYDRAGKVRDRTPLNKQLDDVGKVDLAADEYLAFARLTDPMLKLSAVTLRYAPAPAAGTPAAAGPLANATAVPLQVSDQDAMAKVRLSAPAGAAYLFQVSYVNADGETVFTGPHRVQLAAAAKKP